MKALISGQAAIAILVDVETLYSVDLNDPERLIERRESEIPLLFGGALDIQQLDAVDRPAVLEALNLAWEKDRSLQLILILLDRDEDKDVRSVAAECISELLRKPALEEYLANRLYSAPLPSQADLSGALEFCKNHETEHTSGFLRALEEDQKEIARRFSAWKELPISLFGSAGDKQAFYFDAVRHGAFRLFVMERGRKSWAILQLLSHPYFRGDSRARKVFQEWAAPFKESAFHTEFERGDDRDEYDEDPEAVAISAGRTIRPREAFERAEKQREAIKQLLMQGEQDLALRFTEELIANQRRTSQPEHTAMSLCDLAQFAKKLGSPELQLEFAKKAIEEAPADAWSYATVGDAYRALSDYQRSQDAYHQAGVYGSVRASLIGRAEVLKDTGQLEDALKIFEQCAKDYPDDVVVRNAQAAALADFGKFSEALDAYNKTLDHYFDHQVTRNGRAQVLREMGQLEKALQEFNSIIRDYPEDIVAYSARGQVLRELGRLEEAEREFADLTKKFPLSADIRVSYARVLRDLGKVTEAISQFEQTIKNHPLFTYGYIGLGDTYRKLGEFAKAIEIYNSAIEHSPRIGSAKNGKASIFVAQQDYSSALRLLSTNPPATVSEWVSYHIRGMAYMRSGKLERAERHFEWGLKEIPWASQRPYFETALASLRIQQRRYNESVELVKGILNPSVRPVAKVLMMHAFGEMGDLNGLEQAYQEIKETSAPIIVNLRDILAERYRESSIANPTWPNHRLFAQECDSLLLAA